LIRESGWVVADLGDRVSRISAPAVFGATVTLAATQLSSRRDDDIEDEYRERLLAVLDLVDDAWNQEESLEWVLGDAEATTTYLVSKGTTPGHALVWLRGVGSLEGLLEAPRLADAVGGVLPADVFDTDHGSWLKSLARGDPTASAVDRWFERSYARKQLDDVGIPAGPAAEWANMGRDPQLLIEVQHHLLKAGTSIAVVWKQHKARPPGDTAWRELKDVERTASRAGIDGSPRSQIIQDWLGRWTQRHPYRAD